MNLLNKEIEVLKKQLNDHSKISKAFKKENGYKNETLKLENRIKYLERMQKDISNAGYFKRKLLQFEYEHLNVFSLIFYALNFAMIYGVIKLLAHLSQLSQLN
jgi:hypothetical protein